MRKQGPGDEDEEGVIRGWLRRADEFIRRPSSGEIVGKTGGALSSPNEPSKPVSTDMDLSGPPGATDRVKGRKASTK